MKKPGRWWLDRAGRTSSCCVPADRQEGDRRGPPVLGWLVSALHAGVGVDSLRRPLLVRHPDRGGSQCSEPPLLVTPCPTLSSGAGLGDPSPNLLRVRSPARIERAAGHPRPHFDPAALEHPSVALVVNTPARDAHISRCASFFATSDGRRANRCANVCFHDARSRTSNRFPAPITTTSIPPPPSPASSR